MWFANGDADMLYARIFQRGAGDSVGECLEIVGRSGADVLRDQLIQAAIIQNAAVGRCVNGEVYFERLRRGSLVLEDAYECVESHSTQRDLTNRRRWRIRA